MATLKEAIQTGKREPDSTRTQELIQAILSGNMDEIATKEGLDLTRIKQSFAGVPTPPPPPPPEEPLIRKIPGIIGRRFERVQEAFRKFTVREITPPEVVIRTVGQAIGAAGEIFGEAAIAGAKVLLPKEAEEKIEESFTRALEESDIPGLVEKYQTFKEANPRAAENLEAAANILSVLPIGRFARPAVTAVPRVVPKVIPAVRRVVPAVREVVEEIPVKVRSLKESLVTKPATVEEIIAPAINARETRKIISERRIVRGKKRRLLGDRPDVVEQSGSIKDAAKTIERRIPDAKKLDDIQLSNQLDTEISSISEELRPQMQAVNLQKSQVDKMNDAWQNLKVKQAKEPEFAAFPGAKRVQKNFEGFLDDLSKPVRDPVTGKFRLRTLNDNWDIAKEYDNSITEAVKKADIQSAPSTQLQKEMWLDNRSIFRDILKDSSEGLGDTAKRAFSDMSDFYLARNNIISKAKINLKGEPSVVKRLLKNQILRYGVAGIGIGSIID